MLKWTGVGVDSERSLKRIRKGWKGGQRGGEVQGENDVSGGMRYAKARKYKLTKIRKDKVRKLLVFETRTWAGEGQWRKNVVSQIYATVLALIWNCIDR